MLLEFHKKNRRDMNSSLKIDRKCIAEAVLPSQEPLLDFSAGYVLPDEISLPSINLEEIGNIEIPLSILDAERLKAFLDRQRDAGASPTLFPSSRKHTFEKCSDRMILSTLENFDISSLVIKMLGLPVSKTMDFEAKFDKLMLFEVDGQYTHTFNSGKEFGTFGTAILQLPVNGGHDGGNFHVEYKGRKATYEDQVDSHKLSSLSSFYDSCLYVMKPITRGWKLTLVFNLVWTNSTIVMPTDFLVFLKSLKKLEEALISWVPQRKEDVFSTEVQQLLKENIKIPLITWIDDKIVSCNEKAEDMDIEDSENSENDDNSENESDSDPSDFWYDDETDCHCDKKISTRKCEEENVLFFVLEEKYFENSLMFHHLQGNDRILADLLRCCPFIDVHLAQATYIKPIARKSTGGMAPEEKSDTKISRWIDSNSAVKDLKINELNWSEKCVGPIRNLLEPCSTETYSEIRLNSAECHYQNSLRCSGEVEIIREKICFHTILVIWPKHQSIGIYCRYGLDMFLNYFESSLTSKLGWQAVAQQQLTQNFHQVVEYCCTYPQRIWTQFALKKGEITLRLLRLCIALRARKEGLEILKILGSEFETKGKKQTLSFVGIQNEQVAQALVQFVCQSNGLGDCIDLIKKLITTHRIFKQFVPITKMIQYFLDAKCVKGAVLVGDGVASSLNNFDQNRVAVLKQSDVSLYLDAIVSLEAYSEASSQERLASLVSLFSKLGFTLKCRLMLELDAQVNSRFIGLDACQLIFLEISENFLSSELRVPSASDALGLLKCFIRVGNPKWLESLLSKMFIDPDEDECERIVLFTKLLSHQSLWKLAKSSELGKISLVFLLDKCPELLLSIMSPSNEVSVSRSTYPHQFYGVTLPSILAKYLQFVLEAERIPELADAHRLSSISLLLSQMKFNQLNHILNVFHKSSSEHWNTSPCYSDMMRDICKSMVSAMKNVKPTREAVSKIVRFFFDFLDKSLSQSLLMKVCAFQAAGGWSHIIKYEFFSDIISSTEVWDKLDSAARLDILNTCASLIESWITEESNTLGENSWNKKTQEELRNVQFSSCAHFFFLIEEHRFDPKQKYVVESFQPYLKKLPCLHLRRFMLKLHTSIITTKPYVKEYPLCLELFTTVCRHFVANNFLSDKLSKEECDKIVNCLFFIDDPRSWERFADEICSKAMITDDNQPFQQTLLNANIQEITKSPLASAAIIRIADYWVSKWKSVAEPPFTWNMPKVVIPNYSEVQKFLHSSESNFIYHLRSIEHFHRFKKNLNQTDLLMNCVSVSDWNPMDRNCRLDKTTEYHKRVLELFQRLTSEMDDVLKFRQSLSQNLAAAKSTGKRPLELGSSSTSSDEVRIVSSKRSKP